MKTKRKRMIILLYFFLSSTLIFACQREGEQMLGQEEVKEIERQEGEAEEMERLELEELKEEKLEEENSEITFQQVSATEAKEMMDTNESFILLDVRNQDEFDEGHIEGALLIPVNQIAELAQELLPDKDIIILVYCRSGRRSVDASQQLVELGYTRVVEFGGIIDWPYDIVR